MSRVNDVPARGYRADPPPAPLLDTHALLWWMADAPELPAGIRTLIAQAGAVVSAACVWEIGIKHRLGRLQGVEDYLAEPTRWHRRWGFQALPIDHDDARLAAALAWEHRDPFDRMLVAQSRRHHLTLVTSDPLIGAFHPDHRWS
jgi:PIN domain nuclease of toxin-antitoxin system